MKRRLIAKRTAAVVAGVMGMAVSIYAGFDVEDSEQPSTHPPLAPEDGETVSINPPPMVWRVDERAATYTLEFARDRDFSRDVIRVEGIDLSFYNHSEVLDEGTWYWRYTVVTGDGEQSRPGPVRSFKVTDAAVSLPVPPTQQLLAGMPGHPRIFTTPGELDAFRERRKGPAREAWEGVKWRADRALESSPPSPRDLVALSEREPDGETPGSNSWREGQPSRRQVIWLVDGEPYWDDGYDYRALNGTANNANILSFAYLISGQAEYAAAARDWLLAVVDARLDYHVEDRAQHDTVVYAYENGLKYAALTYDRIHDHLSEDERARVLDHIEYHSEAAYEYLRDRVGIHLEYQRSHPQQCMHALLTTVMAVATDIPAAEEWTDYLVRQYANRIAWTSEDGGYFEGQTYGHKFRWILEGLAAMRTATGINLFEKPRIGNSGEFWLYAMALNYWYHHGGDVYSLLWPWGNSADAYISNLMASMNEDPYVQWWSETVFANPDHIPFQYLSDTDIEPKPPVDIPQARLFPDTGQLAAYDRFYDHLSDRIFFRSSWWGGHSHAHADQNNFVIHSGGEILAADTGYYTYYGDDYHMKWSVTTNTHNSMLINGEGQPKGIDYKGDITEFFHTPDYTFFAGDASKAYEEPMKRFERAILFIRPGIYVVYDELAADEPSEFSWLLNTFQETEIDESARVLTVPQQDRRLRVQHLLPADLVYSQSNERRYPIQTRAWSRFTEAFPEPWHIRVTTAEKAREERFLALLNTYSSEAGNPIGEGRPVENATTLGVAFDDEAGEETVLFRRHLRENVEIYGNGIQSNGLAAAVARTIEGNVRRWMVSHGSRLYAGDRRLLRMEAPAEVYGATNPPGARAMFRVSGAGGQEIRFHVDREPSKVMAAPRHQPAKAQEIAFAWDDGELLIDLPDGFDGVLWVDPEVDPRESLPGATLTVKDGAGEYEVQMRVFAAENGEWVAYAELGPREAGEYWIESSDGEAELLVQDRWTPVKSTRGRGEVTGPLRDKTELFFRFAPGGGIPRFHAGLAESYAGRIVNLLRNGDFEEGIPDYPPRGWNVNHNSRSPDEGWPGWTREDAVGGDSAMRFVRPDDRVTARSQPMRLSRGGDYVLRFQARGDATHARVRVAGSRATGGTVSLEPSEDWREYRMELAMVPGYCEVFIHMDGGGEPDQVLWIDDMEFGPVEPGNPDEG